MITADNLRDAADRLAETVRFNQLSADVYICHALQHFIGDQRALEFQAFVRREGWTIRPTAPDNTAFNTLYFDEDNFPFESPERQAVRFMLCELLACAVEDGALTIGDA